MAKQARKLLHPNASWIQITVLTNETCNPLSFRIGSVLFLFTESYCFFTFIQALLWRMRRSCLFSPASQLQEWLCLGNTSSAIYELNLEMALLRNSVPIVFSTSKSIQRLSLPLHSCTNERIPRNVECE